MQISRHWRMNPQRYRLEGIRYPNGEVSLQARPGRGEMVEEKPAPARSEQHKKKVSVVYTA